MIENIYRLQVMNVSELPERYAIAVSGLNAIAIGSVDS